MSHPDSRPASEGAVGRVGDAAARPALRAVCFDATGTLIEPAEPVGELYHRVAREHGVDLPAWRLDDAFRRILRQAPPRRPAGADLAERALAERRWWRELVRQTFQATDSTARFADLDAFVADLFERYRQGEAWRLRPGARETLSALRRRGLRLAVASNFDHRLPDILEALDLADFFDCIAMPAQHGLCKPEADYFRDLAECLGLPLGALAYVGDDAPAVLGAIAGLGLRVVDVRELARLEALLERLGPSSSGWTS